MQQTPIVISGSVAIDRIMSFRGRYRDHLNADKLDSVSVSIFLDSLQDTHGGVGANIAYSLALLGDEPILLSSAGPDATAYLEELAHHGINITHVHESKLPTASFCVITDSDQNQVGGFYPGAMFDSDSLSFAPWKNADPLAVVAPLDPKTMRRLTDECAQWKLRLFYDPGQQVTNLPAEHLAAGVKAAEILIVNEYELSVLAKKIGWTIKQIKQTVPIIITTLGKKGSVIEGSRVIKPITVGVCKPRQVADPTGAGDAFRSGFLYGFVRGWHLKACAQMGATAAAYAIETVGTQTHRFTLEQVKVRYKEAFGEDLPA